MVQLIREMEMEARTCIFLSGRLSPPYLRVVLATYTDVDEAFLGGKGYCQTLAQLTGWTERLTYCHNNSQKLLNLIAEMLSMGCGVDTAHAICCAFKIPAYHLLKVITDGVTQERLMIKSGSRTYLTSKYMHRKSLEYKQFSLFKKSTERSGWWRYAYEIHCLCGILTSNFTVRIEGTNNDFCPSDEHLYRRIQRLVVDGFGDKYATVLGSAALEAAYTAYSLLTHGRCADTFDYCLRPRKKVKSREVSVAVGGSPVDHLEWFLAGKYKPMEAPAAPKKVEPASLEPRYKTLVFPVLEATMHVNVQVAHTKVLSKERMLHGVSGKSLAFTVIKKKTSACSSYKAVEADCCVPTSNSLNFNIQGYDLSLKTAQVYLTKLNKVCSVDDMEPLTVSHARYSTHSFQNGLQNTNTFRHKVVGDNQGTCSKLDHFPVVRMVNAGLLHRETVLVNVKPNIPDVAQTIHKIIRGAAEIDQKMSALIFELELDINELIDNHVLGLVKTAYLFGREDAARNVTDLLLFDRLLVGLNPKTTKSEFADKSKFDSESKGKASKKIKVVDKTKDRKGFLVELGGVFPDVLIDPCNSNSRGKWSFADRINHSPDWVFYSNFTLAMLTKLREKYPKDKFSSFNKMLDKMHKECNKYTY